MNKTSEFVVGEHYTNDQIRFSLEVGNLGGIRPALRADGSLRHLAVMTSTEEGRQGEYGNPYQDRIEGEILTFTGSGRKGNQALTGVNRRIAEQLDVPYPIFGFMNHGRQSYEFLGLLELLRYYQERQIDQTKALRTVWIFEFRIHKHPPLVPIEVADALAKAIFKNRTPQPEQEVVSHAQDVPVSNDSLRAEDVRAELLQVNPYSFERLVKAVAEKVGFVNVEVTRSSGDGGIDVTGLVSAENDFFGGTLVQIQAKRWRHAVGSIEINNFRGALSSMAKGVFVTTSYYTRAAIENAYHPQKSCVTLIDGTRFSAIVVRAGISLREFSDSAK